MSRAEQIDMIRRHVVEGERHVAKQHGMIERLHELGGDVRLAGDLLEVFEVSLTEHRRHFAQMLAGEG